MRVGGCRTRLVLLGLVKARREVVAVGEGLAGEVERWMAARLSWWSAAALRDREVRRARGRLVAATGGLGLDRWERACEKRRFRTIEDAKRKARAIRARPAVEAALADLERIEAERDTAVETARRELAVLSQRILAYGRLAVDLTGLSASELDRLARSSFKTGQ
jgi:hypothetical protein